MKTFLACLLLASAATVATAQVTYTYTGHPFNSVSEWPQGYPSAGTHVMVSITLPAALPANATTCIVAMGNPTCQSGIKAFYWQISDGYNTIANSYPNGISGAVLDNLTFSTDANGNIVNWNVDATNSLNSVLGVYHDLTLEIRTTNEPSPGFENDSDVSSMAPYLDSISASPGSWTSSMSGATGATVPGVTLGEFCLFLAHEMSDRPEPTALETRAMTACKAAGLHPVSGAKHAER